MKKLAIRKFCASAILCASFAHADTTEPTTTGSSPDKSRFTLFNPTPSSLMRDFAPNRPSVTEGPNTIDSGHVQLELSFAEYSRDRDKGETTEQYNYVPMAIRTGILNNFEVDLFLSPWSDTLLHPGVASRHVSGFGDLECRGTLNLWGNDGGQSAGAIMGFIRLPTGSGGVGDHHIEGGIILPLSLNLPAGFDLGTMAEFDFDRNSENRGYGVDFLHTVTIGHDVVGPLAAYVEYVGISPLSTGRTYLAYFDVGFTWHVSKDVQLDAGTNIGISRKAQDLTVFVGMSFRV